MPDLFISYSRADKDAVARLTAALQSAGYSLWWDTEIAGGVRYSKEIEKNLAQAKAVIVAWSKNAVESRPSRNLRDAA